MVLNKIKTKAKNLALILASAGSLALTGCETSPEDKQFLGILLWGVGGAGGNAGTSLGNAAQFGGQTLAQSGVAEQGRTQVNIYNQQSFTYQPYSSGQGYYDERPMDITPKAIVFFSRGYGGDRNGNDKHDLSEYTNLGNTFSEGERLTVSACITGAKDKFIIYEIRDYENKLVKTGGSKVFEDIDSIVDWDINKRLSVGQYKVVIDSDNKIVGSHNLTIIP